MGDDIDTLAALEAVIGRTPPAVHLKVIDHLDAGALDWIARSPCLFAAFGDAASVAVTLGGGAPGFVGATPEALRLPLAALDDPALARPGACFASLFLVPGLGETLRANGHVASVADGAAVIAVAECYLHCAKALIRSDFWRAPPMAAGPGTPPDFVAASRFMALATVDPGSGADLSPKGDPAGCMVRLDGDGLWFADRPGNRRVDSFRNIIAQPRVAAALLIPGLDRVAVASGTARLTADEARRARFAVRDKVPLLAVGVTDLHLDLRPSPALARARLWPAPDRAEGLDPAKLFVAHVRLNRDKGLGARLAGAVVSVPGLMRKGLEKDYRTNLY